MFSSNPGGQYRSRESSVRAGDSTVPGEEQATNPSKKATLTASWMQVPNPVVSVVVLLGLRVDL